ncbi:MAG: porin, partial [Paracoccaceae bacterium]
MKKVLLATTALVATAGFAAADIKITGGAIVGMKYVEDSGAGNNNSDTELHQE